MEMIPIKQPSSLFTWINDAVHCSGDINVVVQYLVHRACGRSRAVLSQVYTVVAVCVHGKTRVDAHTDFVPRGWRVVWLTLVRQKEKREGFARFLYFWHAGFHFTAS